MPELTVDTMRWSQTTWSSPMPADVPERSTDESDSPSGSSIVSANAGYSSPLMLSGSPSSTMSVPVLSSREMEEWRGSMSYVPAPSRARTTTSSPAPRTSFTSPPFHVTSSPLTLSPSNDARSSMGSSSTVASPPTDPMTGRSIEGRRLEVVLRASATMSGNPMSSAITTAAAMTLAFSAFVRRSKLFMPTSSLRLHRAGAHAALRCP